jgi:hypothetical protein
MSLLPEIERELLRAARGLPAMSDRLSEPAGQSQRRRLAIAGTLAASLIVVVVVAGGLLVMLHHSASHAPTRPPAAVRRFLGVPHSQPGVWRKGGTVCPLAAPNRYLPKRAGCVSVDRADIDGDGYPDLILLYGHPTTHRARGGFVTRAYTLKILRSRGGELTKRMHLVEPPTITAIANVNNQPGDEIFLHLGSISSGSTVGVYAFDGRRLLRVGTFNYGGDSAVAEGFACHQGHPATIVQHTFMLNGSRETGPWKRTDTTYTWVGAHLRRTATTHTTQRHGPPPKHLTDAGC